MAVRTDIIETNEIKGKDGGALAFKGSVSFEFPPTGEVASWGNVGGDIEDQIDLKQILDDKVSKEDNIDGGIF